MAQQGVGDQADEEGEGDDPLVGAAAMAVEDAVEEVVVGEEVEQAQGGVGQRQAPADREVEGGAHGSPSKKFVRGYAWKVLRRSRLGKANMFKARGHRPGSEAPFYGHALKGQNQGASRTAYSALAGRRPFSGWSPGRCPGLSYSAPSGLRQ